MEENGTCLSRVYYHFTCPIKSTTASKDDLCYKNHFFPLWNHSSFLGLTTGICTSLEISMSTGSLNAKSNKTTCLLSKSSNSDELFMLFRNNGIKDLFQEGWNQELHIKCGVMEHRWEHHKGQCSPQREERQKCLWYNTEEVWYTITLWSMKCYSIFPKVLTYSIIN